MFEFFLECPTTRIPSLSSNNTANLIAVEFKFEGQMTNF